MSYKYQPKTKEELIEVIKKEIFEVQGTPDNPNWQADLNCIDTSLITDMSRLFAGSEPLYFDIEGYNLEKFNGDISKWDVSNVKDMSYMFAFSEFNGDISNWDVSNVESMSGLFLDSKFNGNISKWDVSNVKDMSYIFAHSQFNQDISNWDVSNVINMSGMFDNASFNKDISNWNVSNVKYMGKMFVGSKFNGDISKWDVSNVEYMNFMFTESEFNRDISNWNVSNVKDMSYMFADSDFNQDISKWNIFNVESMNNMFRDSKFNKDIGFWPEKLKEQTKLENISVSPKYEKLPDEIIFPETVKNILNRKDLLYKAETIAKLFIFSLKNDDKIFDFKTIYKQFLERKIKDYKKKGYKSSIIKKIIFNDIADILRYLGDNRKKFLDIIKNNQNLNIDI